MSDKESENLHERWYTIKFCVELKKIVIKMKEMLDVANQWWAINRLITINQLFCLIDFK